MEICAWGRTQDRSAQDQERNRETKSTGSIPPKVGGRSCHLQRQRNRAGVRISSLRGLEYQRLPGEVECRLPRSPAGHGRVISHDQKNQLTLAEICRERDVTQRDNVVEWLTRSPAINKYSGFLRERRFESCRCRFCVSEAAVFFVHHSFITSLTFVCKSGTPV
jgi:hypothetical protein